MTRVFAIILLVSVVLSPCYGRLSESELALSQRYGPPKTRPAKGPYGSRALTYSQDGWLVQAWFINDRCHQIKYSKIGAGRLSPEEVNLLLSSNGEGLSWKKEPIPLTVAHIILPSLSIVNYTRADGHVRCEKHSSMMVIRSGFWANEMDRDSKRKEEEKRKVPNF
ncbi:MAG: hypothetical protein P1U89_11850 [Verrucomicrobiales bacterium]|nr:hypothetical protein [Verrucomicrobiales bacterium]